MKNEVAFFHNLDCCCIRTKCKTLYVYIRKLLHAIIIITINAHTKFSTLMKQKYVTSNEKEKQIR